MIHTWDPLQSLLSLHEPSFPDPPQLAASQAEMSKPRTRNDDDDILILQRPH
jgi:hypothetical protein